jgi:hypothetical protein
MGALPAALAARGHRVMVVAPRHTNGGADLGRYAEAAEAATEAGPRVAVQLAGGRHELTFHRAEADGVDWVFVDHPVFQRPGTPYGGRPAGALGGPRPRGRLCCRAPQRRGWRRWSLVKPGGAYVVGRSAPQLSGRSLPRPRHDSPNTACRPRALPQPLVCAQKGDASGPFKDNLFRFALLSLAALEAPLQLKLGPDGRCGAAGPVDPPAQRPPVPLRHTSAPSAAWHPPLPCLTPLARPYGQDVTFVANDWHAALLPVFLASSFKAGGAYQGAHCVLAIHNLAHQVGPGRQAGRQAGR